MKKDDVQDAIVSASFEEQSYPVDMIVISQNDTEVNEDGGEEAEAAFHSPSTTELSNTFSCLEWISYDYNVPDVFNFLKQARHALLKAKHIQVIWEFYTHC